MVNWLEAIGRKTTHFVEEVGRITDLFLQVIKWTLRPPLGLKNIFKQMEEVGVRSIPVVMVTALSTGMVLAHQSYTGFQRFEAESLVGTVVALSITRELGPVLTGLMVAGFAGAAMAAELGTMRVTEQIDAMATMAVNPIKYLIVPRFLASLTMLPVLTIFGNAVGIGGGYFVSVNVLGVNPVVYIRRTTDFLEFQDIYGGLLKAMVFGILIAIASCYKGFNAEGGAEGVGKAVKGAVVLSFMLILISDYFLTVILY